MLLDSYNKINNMESGNMKENESEGEDWVKVEQNVHNFDEEKELIGIFKESIPSEYEGNDFIIDARGKGDVKVFGKTALQNKLNVVKPGTPVKIVYNGEKKSEKSGRTYRDFSVFTK